MSILIKILDHFVISHSKSSETFKGTALKLTADGMTDLKKEWIKKGKD